MSTSLSQRSSGTAANPTRQQLDELDALLQRMMNLPVNKLENAPAEPTPPVSYTTPDEVELLRAAAAPKIDFHALKQRLEAMPELLEELSARAAAAPPADAPATEGDGNWVPLSSTWQPSSLTWKPLAQSWQQPAANPAAPEPAAEAPPPVVEPPAAPTTSHHIRSAPPKPVAPPMELTGEPPVARWAAPLVWFNRAFDLCLTPLGPVGRFLRTRPGRLGLAIVGLGCLAAAVVVLLSDWIGWTS